MSALRDEIRAILREEISALRREDGRAEREVVDITGSADLNHFARDLLARATDPAFVQAVNSGAHRFELAGEQTIPSPSVPVSSARLVTRSPQPEVKACAEFSKSLVTERDINALDACIRRLRVPKTCRLTPLASDEARHRSIRIERFAS